MSTEPPLPTPPRPGSARRRSAARQPLSRALIVETALAIVDVDGLDGLSMRRVADKLETGPASLYAHVADKEELLDLLYDRVFAEIPAVDSPPNDDPWQERIKAMARAYRDTLAAHKDIARVGLGRVPSGEGALPAMERMLSVLAAGGLPPLLVGLAPDLLGLYIEGTAFEQSQFDHTVGFDEIDNWTGQLRAYFESLPEDRFPTIRSHAEVLTGGDDVDRFEFGLEVIVRGLEAIAADAKR